MVHKKFPIAAAIVLVIGVLFFWINQPGVTIKIDDIAYWVRLADTQIKREKGLMNVKHLPKNQGMLFVFESTGQYDFWNKNTLIALDLLYLRDNVIVEIGSLPPISPNRPPTIFHPRQKADAVVELNGGEAEKNKFMIGDEVRISR